MLFRSAKAQMSLDQSIKSYIRSRLLTTPLKGINSACCAVLAERSQDVFLWASLACNYITERSAGDFPRQRYDQLVGADTRASKKLLDGLYEQVLDEIFRADPSALDALRVVRHVMAVVVYSRGSLTASQVLALLGRATPTASDLAILRHLGLLFTGVEATPNREEPVRPIHATLQDYLLDRERSGKHCVDTPDNHRLMALGCLSVLSENLRSDMCDLSVLPGGRAPTSASKALELYDEKVECTLSYAARFWLKHVQAAYSAEKATLTESSHTDSQILKQIQAILTQKFLAWIELLCLFSSTHPSDIDVCGLVGQLSVLSDLEPVVSHDCAPWVSQRN